MSDKKKAGSGSDLRIFYILGGLIIVALAYFFGFNKLSSKASDIAAQNESKQLIVDQLNSMVAKKDEIIRVTEEDIENTEKEAKKYPEKYEEENEIVFLKDLEENSGITIRTIDMTTNTEIDMTQINAIASAKAGAMYQAVSVTPTADSTDAASDGTTEDATTDAAAGTDVTTVDNSSDLGVGTKTTVECSYIGKYDQIRSAIDYVYAQKDRMTVPSISIQYDEQTGKLNGIITIDMYSMENIGHEYVVPKPQEILPPINGNIFKSK